MAPQLTATKGPPLRGERRWISRATTSFPVPVSPVTSTEMSVEATFSMRRKTSRMEAPEPTRSPYCRVVTASRSATFSRRSESSSRPFCTSSEAWAVKTVSRSRARWSKSETTLSLPR
jgi:hypothetical protein